MCDLIVSVPDHCLSFYFAARDVIKHCFYYGNCIDNNSRFAI